MNQKVLEFDAKYCIIQAFGRICGTLVSSLCPGENLQYYY